jgi:hypothetical protein
MMTATHLEEAVTGGGITSVNFFNGRLLTGEDLSREQLANRAARLRLGRALGDGVAYGLDVSEALGISSTARPVLRIEPGLAVNAEGALLELAARTDVLLVEEGVPGDTAQIELFADCPDGDGGTYSAGFGVYLLAIGPAERGQGRAPTSGLGNVDASCNTNVFVEGVTFRLIRVRIGADEVPSRQLLRNHVAAKSFGVGDEKRVGFLSNPFGAAPAGYGLVDELRPCLTSAEVPLGVLAWTATGGIQFVDTWAVRRRIVAPAADERWPLLLGDRARAESEAMFLQFERYAGDLVESLASPRTLAATDRFEYLPPVGMIPIVGSPSSRGFNAGAFFGTQASTRAEMTDARLFRSLLHEGLLHEPIEVGAGKEQIQLYLLWENVTAVRQGTSAQLALVFAKNTIPYRGIARFGDAYWDLSRFAQSVL